MEEGLGCMNLETKQSAIESGNEVTPVRILFCDLTLCKSLNLSVLQLLHLIMHLLNSQSPFSEVQEV